MNDLTRKKFLIITALVMLTIGIFILSWYVGREDSPSSDIDPIETTQPQYDTRKIREAVVASFGKHGSPEAFTYPRPVGISSDIHSHTETGGWLTVNVELLDEPPESDYRYLTYIIKVNGEVYEVVAHSGFDLSGIEFPDEIPTEVLEEMGGSHE